MMCGFEKNGISARTWAENLYNPLTVTFQFRMEERMKLLISLVAAVAVAWGSIPAAAQC
jgi:hypothetical protein